MATKNEETIIAILEAWGRGSDAAAEQIAAHFAPDCKWVQPGIATTTGPDEAIALIKGLGAMDSVSIKVDFHNVASSGNVVFTERVDHLVMKDGARSMSIPVVGVTVFKDGKVSEWREYFDPAILTSG